MKPGGKGGFTADICDCMQDSQAENDVRLQAGHAHKTDPVLSVAMFRSGLCLIQGSLSVAETSHVIPPLNEPPFLG